MHGDQKKKKKGGKKKNKSDKNDVSDWRSGGGFGDRIVTSGRGTQTEFRALGKQL